MKNKGSLRSTDYPDDLCDNHIHKTIYFEKYFKGYEKILDLGCNRGNFIQFAPDKIEGCDNNEIALGVARKRGFNVKYVNIKEGLPYEDNTFDAINLKEVIEHVVCPQDLLVECRRILKADGKIVICTPDISRLGLEEFYNAVGHICPFTKDRLRKLLLICKFRDVKVVRWEPYVFGVNTLFRKWNFPFWIYNIFERYYLERFGKEVVGVGYK